MPKKVRKQVVQLELELARQGICGKPHPEFGKDLCCKLPVGHKGPHTSMTGPDEHWY